MLCSMPVYPGAQTSLFRIDGSARLRTEGKDMTEQEWDAFARLYREVWKAHADLATLRIMLRHRKLTKYLIG